MAKLWNLPVLYVIENNRYAMGTSVERATAQQDFSKRGLSFNIEGEQVDGMDVRLVHDAAKRALARVRDGGGPYILEMMTYRYRGHSMSDPAKYRSKDEVTTMRAERDPIEQVKNRILEKRYGSEDTLKQIETEVRALVTEAADFATADAEPAAAELWTDIYAEA
jgi:pyruvate dehydrogenase E1 component alpha subunit